MSWAVITQNGQTDQYGDAWTLDYASLNMGEPNNTSTEGCNRCNSSRSESR